jgi:hypothetical protein
MKGQVAGHSAPGLTRAAFLPTGCDLTSAGIKHANFSADQELSVNATAETLTQRFEPNVQLAKGQVIGIAALAALVLAGLDYYKLQLEHSFVRAACVAGVGFVALSALFWFKAGRYGCQTVVLDESGLTLETEDNRSVLPWAELSEIILVGDSVLKFQSRNAREPLQLHNTGFTLDQWSAIKQTLQSRGFTFKMGYSAL